MENTLPEWFNEKEFEVFLAEGPLTHQAWMKGMKRWQRTKVVLRHLLGKTPMKYISRTMRNKHAIMANTAIQNARDIQAAKNREEDMDAKQNFIRQEQVDIDFGSFLDEGLRDTSNPAVSFGKKSTGEVAREKNPTGNEKKFARLKKREQRRRKRLRGLKAESFDLLEAERKESRQNQGRGESEKRKTDAQDKANVTHTNPSGGKDTDPDPPTEEARKGKLQNILVVRSNGKVKIISKNSLTSIENPELIAGGQKGPIKNKTELKKYLNMDDFQATEMSNILFPKESQEAQQRKEKKEEDGGGKPKATPAPKPKPQRAAPKPKAEKQTKGDINKFTVLPVRPEDENRPLNYVNYQNAERLALFPELIALSEAGDNRLAEYMGETIIRDINNYLQSNPGAVGKGRALRDKLLELARQNPELQGQELMVVPFGDERVCSDNSEFFKSRGAIDTTPKSDVLVLKKSDFGKFMSALESDNCVEEMAKLAENSYRASIKKGKGILGSSQATETLAVMEAAQETLRNYFQGKMDPEVSKMLSLLIEETMKLKALGNSASGVFRTASENTYTSIRKAIEANGGVPVGQGQAGYAEQQYVYMTTQIMDNMNKIIDELFRNKIVKSAIAWEIASGNNKFGPDSMSTAQGLVCLDRSGQFTGTVPLFASFEEAMKSKAFGLFVDSMSINVSTKSAKSKGQDIRNLSSAMWTKFAPGGLEMQNLQASFDPFADEVLNVLFEYTFSPADITVTTEVPPITQMSSPAQQTMQPNSQSGMNAMPMQTAQGADPNQPVEQDVQLSPDNILTVLAGSGFFDEILFKPADFGEIGLRISSMESPVYNRVVVNGRVHDISVINTGLDESFISEYELINDDMVELVKSGAMLEDVYNIFNDEIMTIVEGKRNYKREYKLFHGKPEQRAKRSKRVLARRKMAKKLGKKAIKGKDIDHKNHNANDNSDSNLRVRSINKNRSDNGHSKKLKETWGAGLEGSWELTLKWLGETPGQLDNIDSNLLKLLMKNKGKGK